jgi:hypothetical protein
VEIVSISGKHIIIGIAAEGLRSSVNCQTNA